MGRDSWRRLAQLTGAFGAVALAAVITVATSSAAHPGRTTRATLRILTLPARADLISGGEAVVRIVVPAGVRASGVRTRPA